MVGVSILPVAIHLNQLYFLFGKEKGIEYGIQGFSDFGGGKEKESIFKGAIREGCEELTGFYGNETELENKIKKAGGTFHINHENKYHVHIFLTDYDENLPYYFGNNHRYLWEKMDNKDLSKTKLFEKIGLDWFTIEDMENRRNEFRPFYRHIVDNIISKKEKIKQFLEKNNKKKNKYHSHNKTHKKNNKLIYN